MFNNFHLKSINLIICKWDSIDIHSIFSSFLSDQLLRVRVYVSLLNFRNEQIITLIVKLSFLILLKQMIVLQDQLCEFLIHHSFLLTLYIFKGVWNDSNKNIKHDYNEENSCYDKNKVDYWKSNFSKLFWIEISQHQLECLHYWLNVSFSKNVISFIILCKDEESSRERKKRHKQNNDEDLHVNQNLYNCFD